jgi:L-lactate dehydrogenase complex protein LldG
MAELHKIVATLKNALQSGARSDQKQAPGSAAVSPGAHRAELASRFQRELESVAGRFLGILTPAEAAARAADVARERNARMVAIGDGLLTDADEIATAIHTAGVGVVRPAPVATEEARAAMVDRIAHCEMAIAEADCAIASTGTLAVVSTERRPSALTLLPPASLLLVQIDRLVPDLAAALELLGAETIATRRVTLITGPSRTADIEKMIVLGVHGPKALDVILVWPRDG